MAKCPACQSDKEAKDNYTGDCQLLQASYILAGLAMMLNIRLSYSSAPYALIRFRLPENLFSVFVRRMASALELWCLPSMLLGNIIDLLQKLIDGGHNVRALKYANGYDIQGTNTKGTHLDAKAGALKDAAGYLFHAAKKLENAASQDSGDTLNKLQGDATNLKNAAAKQDKTGLYNAAHQLATGRTGLDAQATAVIAKFGEVERAYTTLMNQASTNGLTGDSMVKAVEKEYNDLKNIYNGILNLTKLAKKSEELRAEAAALGTLQDAANTLKTNVEALRDGEADKAHDKAKIVIQNYESVKIAYYSDPTAKTSVKDPFDAVNTAYDHIRIHDKPWKFWWIIVPSIITQWLNFLTYVILFFVYVIGGEQGHLTLFYLVIAVSGVVFGINMTLIYSVDFFYIPVYIAGENSFPILTSFIHYLATLIFGNRRKYDSDFLLVGIDIIVAILISFVAAVVWTVGYLCEIFKGSTTVGDMKHIHAFGFSGDPNGYQLSPALMIVVGMGLVYAIYPGIAPGMIVPFYLIDKIEMVLLIATIFPPVIIAILRKYKPSWSPQHFVGPGMGRWKPYEYASEWGRDPDTPVHAYLWHLFDLLIIIKISLAAIFIYSLHYKDSGLSRSIVNQPKMSTFLSITFYMCHEILLAVGFSGFIGNDGGDLILVPQYIGALFMIFLAFYSEGYIIEYKSHDPQRWPTTGMKRWVVFFYWYCFVVIRLISLIVFIMIMFNVCSDGYCDFK